MGVAGRRGGVGVGIAAAIKLTPGIFILLFLLTRRTKAAVTAAVTFGVCGLIGYLVAPGASRLYWTRYFYDTKRVDAPYIGNQSIYGAALRIFHGPAHVGDWYLPLTVLVAVVGLATATVFARRGDWLRAVAVTGVTGLLISPVSWTHHWVYVVPALIALARDGKRGRIAAGCALPAVHSGPAVVDAPLAAAAHLRFPRLGDAGRQLLPGRRGRLPGLHGLARLPDDGPAAPPLRPGRQRRPRHGGVRPGLDRPGQPGTSRSANAEAIRLWPLALG